METDDAVLSLFRQDQQAKVKIDLGPKSALATKLNFNFQVPIYNFDKFWILPNAAHDRFISVSSVDQFYNEALVSISNGTFHLPYSECIFVHRHEIDNDLSLTHIVHCKTIGNKIDVRLFYYRHIKPKDDCWYLMPIIIELSPETIKDMRLIWWLEGVTYDLDMKNAIKSEAYRTVECLLTEVIISQRPKAKKSSIIISQNPTTSPSNNFPAKTNPTSTPIRIDWDAVQYVNNSDLHSIGSPKSPHDRQGHLRRYSSGKNIWINSLKVKGGRKIPATYNFDCD